MTKSKPTRYREITVTGPPRELGRQIGEAAREETRGFCEIALQRVNQTVRISRERAIGIARQSLEFAENYRPDFVEELRGTAGLYDRDAPLYRNSGEDFVDGAAEEAPIAPAPEPTANASASPGASAFLSAVTASAAPTVEEPPVEKTWTVRVYRNNEPVEQQFVLPAEPSEETSGGGSISDMIRSFWGAKGAPRPRSDSRGPRLYRTTQLEADTGSFDGPSL